MDETKKTARSDGLRYKLLPDGHIRAYDANTHDKRGISEGYIYPTYALAPTIRTCISALLLVTDGSTANALREAAAR